jgi:fumarate reductase subunit C
MVLALCVLIHLVTILVAVKGGLSAAEILARTRGNVLTVMFYGIFVVACAVHAPIGLMKILTEWTPLPKSPIIAMCAVFGIVLFAVGCTAVWGVYRG